MYGHHHLNTTDMDAQKKFYVDALGGSVAKIGSGDRQQEIIKFPNVLIFFRPMQAPTGGSIGTTVNHIGFSVPDHQAAHSLKIKASGFKMIAPSIRSPRMKKVTDDIAAASPTTNLAFALGPEDVKVEFVEVKSQKAPIQLHHIHFFGQMNTEMQAWYAKTFGATILPANPGSAFVQDQLPGVFLNFTPSPTPTVGTAVDRSITSGSRSRTSRHAQAPAAGHQTGSSLHQGAPAWHRDRVHHRSLGNEYRNDGRPRRPQVGLRQNENGHSPSGGAAVMRSGAEPWPAAAILGC